MIPAELMYEGWDNVVLKATGFYPSEIMRLPHIDVEAYSRVILKALKALYENHPFAGEKL